jgi:phytoene dehydrogenase-like protein
MIAFKGVETVGRSTDMAETFDGIILGTGHNALVLQAYLSRAGLSTLSIDRAPVAGGGLRTEEDPRFPGVFHNTHSFFHRAVTAMPWYRDLELERHGVRYIEPELNVALLTRSGDALCWWTDLQRTIESFSEWSAHDAAKLQYWHDEFVPIVQEILIPEAQSPPLPAEQREQRLQQTELGRRLLEVSALSPLEFVDREFENDTIKAGLLFFNGLREVDLRQKGFGHSIPALLASPHKAQMCVGGSAALARGLCTDVIEHGGRILTGAPLRRLLVDNGRVAGVECQDGRRFIAKGFVASGLNPQQTFLELLDPEHLPAEIRTKAADFQYNLLAPLFALNLVLTEPPSYRHAERKPELANAFMAILGLERFDQFSEIVRCHEQGGIPGTVMWGACPTQFDPTQATEGRHTAFMWEKPGFGTP